jgi:molybdate-binding protein
MIEGSEFEKFIKIIEKANEFLHGQENSEFHILGINWDDSKGQWVVSYISDYSNHEFINVWVVETKVGLMMGQHSFDPINIEFN